MIFSNVISHSFTSNPIFVKLLSMCVALFRFSVGDRPLTKRFHLTSLIKLKTKITNGKWKIEINLVMCKTVINYKSNGFDICHSL